MFTELIEALNHWARDTKKKKKKALLMASMP